MTTEASSVANWAIDPSHTLAEFSVRHLMISRVKGRFGQLSGTITVDPNDLTVRRIDVEIDVASIDTRDAQRDEHLRSADFFDVENHPKMHFKSREVDLQGRRELRGHRRFDDPRRHPAHHLERDVRRPGHRPVGQRAHRLQRDGGAEPARLRPDVEPGPGSRRRPRRRQGEHPPGSGSGAGKARLSFGTAKQGPETEPGTSPETLTGDETREPPWGLLSSLP